jgi:hypothetical protein
MKGRPRKIERRVAEELSKYFATIGGREVWRVPVLGPTGPDIDINEYGLVIDVKSRLEVPKGIYFDHAVCFDRFFALPMSDLPKMHDCEPEQIVFRSKIVSDYYDHMDEWTLKKRKDGITALVLHKPGMPVKKAMLIVGIQNMPRLKSWGSPII